jgi:hypothetical protein
VRSRTAGTWQGTTVEAPDPAGHPLCLGLDAGAEQDSGV